ncbi:50S ribosome-binding GTPase [Helcobacillus massiliensis]|uniref:GTPase n=1 Tax=Helcobacillus massiliensis TaxID=521392 RepID=UPI0021A2CF97|nr:GTPase [Helcobacillus massiliensis]MCT1558411.1 50S ribosome-binding GTPase [Helcobacillus massiliensis]MCT2036817.1 50S ribosome-binding GTPase [Helcobacillus massiliensis]MCT2332598.1 50S ribosome-binding GTPase [Helcobacillus massiliensis]
MTTISDRLRALEDLRTAGGPLLDDAATGELTALDARVRERVGLSAEHTVVGLFGATGSGKSTLFNALAGEEVSRVAVRRPTTAQPVAAIVENRTSPELEDEAHRLLDWLEVSERHIVSPDGADPRVILVDMPDFDSVQAANRAVAERLADLVDVVVWVSDPEKYADRVMHQEFIARFASHRAVTLSVINQIDRVRDRDRDAVVQSFAELLGADGLPGAEVLATSARTGEGVRELLQAASRVAKQKEAIAQRLTADFQATAARVGPMLGASQPEAPKRSALRSAVTGGRTKHQDFRVPGLPDTVPTEAHDGLVDACSRAAQVDAIARAVGDSYIHRASRSTGWPGTRWLRSFRPDPLARMRLGFAPASRHGRAVTAGGADGSAAGEGQPEFVSRSSLSLDAPGSRAVITRGADRFAEVTAGDAPAPWPARLRDVVDAEAEHLPDGLDYVLTHTQLPGTGRSWWWLPLNIIQWLALLVALVGLGWLLGLSALGFFGIPQPELPMVQGLGFPLPVPTAMIILGLGLGIVLAVLSTLLARVRAGSLRSAARRRLRTSIASAIDDTVADAAQEELDRARSVEGALSTLARA